MRGYHLALLQLRVVGIIFNLLHYLQHSGKFFFSFVVCIEMLSD